VIGLYETVNGVFYTNGGTGTFSKGNDVDTLKTINAKLGVGLYFDTNDAIAADVYTAGQGISMSNPSGINVLNQEYYFDTQVTCSLSGSFQRSFQKTTNEPALGALINVHNVGQSDSWTGPVFVGLTESSVKCTYNTDNVVGPFTYKGKTWYCTGGNWWVDGSLTDDNNNILRIPGQNQSVFPDEINDFTIAKLIIDTAGLLDNNDKVITAKLGSGLRFDSNDAIEAIPYDLPIASASVLGGIKVGANLTIDQNGVLDGTPDTTYDAGDGLFLGVEYTHNQNTDIPETYLQVEYLESTGTQYINTGQRYDTGYYHYEVDCEIDNENNNQMFGMKYWYDHAIDIYGGVYRACDSSSYIINSTIPAGDRVYCTLDRPTKTTTIESDSTTFTHTFSGDYSPSSSVYPVVLFAYWTSWSDSLSGYGKGKIYSFKYYSSSDTLTREMYPCVRKSDNVPGMYDTVNNVFYTNNGTGDFSYGDPLTVTDYIPGNTFNVKLGSGLYFDSNGRIATSGGGGGTYQAGDGIEIIGGASNDTISAKLGNGLRFDSNDAIEAIPYDLPIASASVLGGVKIGQRLTIDANGVLSADSQTYTLPAATTTTLGGIIVGDGLSVDQYGEISVDEMEGADGTDPGSSGTVPQPVATDNTKYLRGDATWNDPIEDFRTDVNAGRKILVLNCVAPPTQPTEPTDYMYTISNNEVTIDKYIGRKTRISVPATIENKPVTTISSLAFKDSNVIRVDLPSSVININ
jgi:hypothetical protein